MDSFILSFWRALLSALKWISPFELLRRVAPKTNTYGWVDIWVLFNLLMSALTLECVVRLGSSSTAAGILVWYGAIRTLEIVVYQMNVVFFDPYRDPGTTIQYAIRSYRRIIVLALHNYIEIVIWFAAIYARIKTDFSCPNVLSTATGAIYYSMVTMATVGYGEVTPVTDFGRRVVFIHIVIAVFITLLILARFVGFLPRPRSLDNSENAPSDPSC